VIAQGRRVTRTVWRSGTFRRRLIGVVSPVAVALAITGAAPALAASHPSAETQAKAKQVLIGLTSDRNARFIPRLACSSDGNSATCRSAGVTLTGVAGVTSAGDSYCALLASGGADCWGYGPNGELGDGRFCESAFPVEVK
jgi:hypothetical protein